jgi:hypothetical protein
MSATARVLALDPFILPAIIPTVADAVAARMRGEIARAPQSEHSFACGYDPATRTITSALHSGVGTRVAGLVVLGDLVAGEMLVHTHPPGGLVEMSDPDLECARWLAGMGIGFAIIDNLVSTLFVAREPRLPRSGTPGWKSWSAGRWMLIRKPRA